MFSWSLVAETAGAVIEAQQVICLRLAAMARGDAAAALEARTMVVEKVQAAFDAGLLLASGGSPEDVVKLYRATVGANLRRLSTLDPPAAIGTDGGPKAIRSSVP
jgi:hypothetical protein